MPSAVKSFTVSRDDSVYEAWPDLALLPSGRLVCTFTECTHHRDRDRSRIVFVFSDDRGRTWSGKIPLSEYTDRDFYFNNSRISLLPDGRPVVICDRVDGTGRYETGSKTVQYLWTGSPSGTEWSEPRILPFCGIVPDKYRVIGGGRHLCVYQRHSPVSGKLCEYLRYSDDGGAGWSDEITVADDPRYNLCEGSVLPVGENDLVCFMRENSGQGIDCIKTVSHDRGETWGETVRMPVPGCHRPVSGYLADGRILMTYRFHQGGKGWMSSKTQNFFSAVFDTDTALASERKNMAVRIMPVDYDRSPHSDLGYSGWVQFPDGEIYIVNYIVDDAPKAQIRGYSLDPGDFVLERQ